MENQFTSPAKKIWLSIPEYIRQTLLNNVWCSRCRTVTTIVDFKGSVENKDLILNGFCKKCGGEVARLIENESVNPVSVKRSDKIDIELTEYERNLLLKMVIIEEELTEKFRLARIHNGMLRFKLSPEDLDILLGHIAAETNHTKNSHYQNQLDALYDKLKNIEMS